MAHLSKLTNTYWVLGKGKNVKRVSKGTPGATKKKVVSSHWYAIFKHPGGKVERIKLARDKEVATVMLAKILRERERGKVGLVDPHAAHKAAPLANHLKDYLAHLEVKGVSPAHILNVKRQLEFFFTTRKLTTLGELHHDHLTTFLVEDLPGRSARTRDTYRTAAIAFGHWLENEGRLEITPFRKVLKPRGEVVYNRRALTPEELQKVLHAARERPLREFTMVRVGPNKGKHLAKLSEPYRRRLLLRGREHVLVYLLAVYTGLRRKEIRATRVCHLHLDDKPYPRIILPPELTKNKKGANLLLVPSYAEELRQWVGDTGRKPDDKLFDLRIEIVKHLQKDLAAAGIPCKDARGRVVDFHALRMTGNMLLAAAGVPIKVRQLFMRHHSVTLTLQNYDDTTETKAAVEALSKLKLT